MKKTEIILGTLAIAGFIMVQLKIAGSSILFVMALSALACFYMYLGFGFLNGIELRKVYKRESYKGISNLRVVGALATGLSISIACIGTLFKVQLYPPSMFDPVALFSLSVILVIALFKWIKTKDIYYTRILKKVIIYGSIFLVWFLIPRNKWLEYRSANHPAYIRAVERSWANPDNRALQDSVEMEWDKIQKGK